MNRRNWIIGGSILAAIVLIGLVVFSSGPQPNSTDYSKFLQQATNGQIERITTSDSSQRITYKLRGDNKDYTTVLPISIARVDDILISLKVPYDNYPLIKNDGAGWLTSLRGILFFMLPILLVLGVFLYMSRRRGDSNSQMGGGPFSFAKSGAKMVTPQKVGITFADVAGNDEGKQELAEVVEFLKSSEKFVALGARIPKGVLLVGPPGTGKTLLAKAVAGEANVPFMSVSGSEFVEMFVGVGAARVRDMFARAKKLAPCIIFIDEVDAIGRRRGVRVGGGTEEREQTLNQILVEMDGFDTNTNVIIIAATNRADVLDPALLRPGRFDRQIHVDNPDLRARLAILGVHSKGKPLGPDVDLERIARQTPGFSGADLANLVNEAAIMTARRNKRLIGLDEMEEAIDRVVAGPERRSRVISEREKIVTAYHEVGHALVAKLVGQVDPVQKISIVARGRMGGYTRVASDEDRTLMTKGQMEDYMAFALGGHAAEELMFGEASTGPSNDIERVSDMARAMVTQYGMGKIGPLALGENTPGGNRHTNYSNAVAYEIDQEVDVLVRKARNRARQLLSDNKRALITISNILMEREIISGTDMDNIIEQVNRDIAAGVPDNLLPYSRVGDDSEVMAFKYANTSKPVAEKPVSDNDQQAGISYNG